MSKSGKALLEELMEDLPEVKDTDLPSLNDRQEFLDKQIEALKQNVYRYSSDIRAGKHYYEKGMEEDDSAAKQVGQNRIEEAKANLKGTLWTLEIMKTLRADLEYERSQTKPVKSKSNAKSN